MCTATVGEWKDGGGSGAGRGSPGAAPPALGAVPPVLVPSFAPSFDISSAFVLDVVLMVTGSLTPTPPQPPVWILYFFIIKHK